MSAVFLNQEKAPLNYDESSVVQESKSTVRLHGSTILNHTVNIRTTMLFEGICSLKKNISIIYSTRVRGGRGAWCAFCHLLNILSNFTKAA